MMTTKSVDFLNWMKAHAGEDLTVHDVAEALGVTINSVTGMFNAFVKKGLGIREKAKIETSDGEVKEVKFLRLTDKGMNFDPTTEEE